MAAVSVTSESARSAAVGTAGTPSRLAISISTSAFMPGFSSPPRLAILMSTANIVTFCSTIACGSILSTSPSNGWFGYAATVTRVSMPGWILPMSVSSTRVRTCTEVRSAIFMSTEPPLTAFVGDVITMPGSTVFSMIVPVIGARTSVSSSVMRAFSTATLVLTTCDSALANSSCVCS